jgi:hypothetical protein
MNRDDDVVSASEIAAWTWCPESWRLEALGAEPENRTAIERGETFHARTAGFEVGSRTAISLGWWLLAAGLLLAALIFVLVRG